MNETLCPSAHALDPACAEKRVIAVNGGTPEAPRIEYLPKSVPVTEAMIAAWSEAPIIPGEVFRVAGTCKQHRCGHWRGERCSLIDRWMVNLEPVADTLAACSIRSTCRAFHQHRAEACRRCPGFVTSTVNAPDDPMASAAHTERTYL